MKQFDVFANPSPRTKARAPFIMVLPDNRFADHAVTVVVPLVRKLPSPVPRLNLEFVLNGETLFLSPLELANIQRSELRQPVDNLSGERDAIVRALDLLFTGI
ncbi:MAG: CcdB family protein [Bauldia sp.]